MKKREQMIKAAKAAMIHVMDVSAEDRVLVVTDQAKRRIGQAFAEAAQEIGCTVTLIELDEKSRPLKEPTPEMMARIGGITAAINAFSARAEETPFRIKWIKALLSTRTIRVGHAPGITEDMMLHGPMNIDYTYMMNLVQKAMEAFENAQSVHILSPAGTDLFLNIEDRSFATDVHITPDHFGNLPAGEIWCAPHEDSANGTLVCDGSIGDLGTVPNPVSLKIERGKITSIECDDPSLKAKLQELLSVDNEASIIGEFGIGLNPGARITGNLLEDEKAFRTIHIAFGNNEEMAGGKNRSKTHRDFLVKDPTVKIIYKDGTERVLMDKGEMKLE